MTAACDFGCGWIAGVCGLAVGHPMDTIKVRQQTLGSSSAWRCAIATIKYEGFFAFYKGMSFPMLSAGVMNSLFFGVYGSSLRVMENHGYCLTDNPSLTAVFLAGCMGGVAQIGVACPVDLVKIKLQAQTGTAKGWGAHYEAGYKGPISCLAGVIKAEGVRGLYRGIVSMLYRDIPASGTYMLVYQWLMRLMLPDPATTKSTDEASRPALPLLSILVAGGLAGSISWGIIMPLDVVKSRLQADRPDKPQYRGMIHCFVDSYQKDGLRVFGRGFSMVMLRAFPANAAIFLGYEHCMKSCQAITM